MAILSNVLENALHGCESSKEKEQKIIFEMFPKNDRLVISCKNSSSMDIVFDQNGVSQNKMRKGIGTSSILHSIKKYHGEIDYQLENHMFMIRILLKF